MVPANVRKDPPAQQTAAAIMHQSCNRLQSCILIIYHMILYVFMLETVMAICCTVTPWFNMRQFVQDSGYAEGVLQLAESELDSCTQELKARDLTKCEQLAGDELTGLNRFKSVSSENKFGTPEIFELPACLEAMSSEDVDSLQVELGCPWESIARAWINMNKSFVQIYAIYADPIYQGLRRKSKPSPELSRALPSSQIFSSDLFGTYRNWWWFIFGDTKVTRWLEVEQLRQIHQSYSTVCLVCFLGSIFTFKVDQRSS